MVDVQAVTLGDAQIDLQFTVQDTGIGIESGIGWSSRF